MTEENGRFVQTFVNGDIHKALTMEAYNKNIPLQQLLLEIISEHLGKTNKKKGKANA